MPTNKECCKECLGIYGSFKGLCLAGGIGCCHTPTGEKEDVVGDLKNIDDDYRGDPQERTAYAQANELFATPQEGMSKRFIRQFCNDHGGELRFLRGIWIEEILAFINTETKQAYSNGFDSGRINGVGEGQNQARAELLKELDNHVRGMKREHAAHCDDHENPSFCTCGIFNYNQALADLLKLIREK